MIIAGLTGGIGHGKTTFAQLLADNSRAAMHFETWEIVAEVATALHAGQRIHPDPDDIESINQCLHRLPEAIRLHTHTTLTFDDIKLTPDRIAEHPEYFAKLFEHLRNVKDNPQLADTEITESTKEAFRPLLQWLGGYLVAVGGSGIWYDELLRRVAHSHKSGYTLVTIGGARYPSDAERIRNAGGVILTIERPDRPNQDSQDLTERQRTLIEPDSAIINDGSLVNLASCAKAVYHDLCLRQLRSQYTASACSDN